MYGEMEAIGILVSKGPPYPPEVVAQFLGAWVAQDKYGPDQWFTVEPKKLESEFCSAPCWVSDKPYGELPVNLIAWPDVPWTERIAGPGK
jgi:hypothetical protein